MSIRILMVDDTKFLRMMLTDLLTRFGYEVVGQAENGLVALEKFKELKPDIVIMDLSYLNVSSLRLDIGAGA